MMPHIYREKLALEIQREAYLKPLRVCLRHERLVLTLKRCIGCLLPGCLAGS